MMSEFTIPKEILWNPIISAGISRYLSRKDRLNCQALIPTWDLLAIRIFALSPSSCRRQTLVLSLLEDSSEGIEIFPVEFASERRENVTQLLFQLSSPTGTGLANVTTLDLVKQPITIEQLRELLSSCPMPRLRVLSLTLAERNPRPQVMKCLKSKLKLEEVAIRFIGNILPYEMLLLMQSFGDVRSMLCDDSSHRRYRLRRWLRNWESYQSWIPPWSFLQMHHASELLDLFLCERNFVMQLQELTLLTEPGHFVPKRFMTSSAILPRIVKYRVLKKPPLGTPQFCRVCVDAEKRHYMPRLHCQSNYMTQDGEAAVNFVACSLMSVEDNCVLHPLNLLDLFVHVSPSGKRPSLILTNTSSCSTTEINTIRWQAPIRSAVEDLIQQHYSEIKRLLIRVCIPGNYEIKTKYARELPPLARDRILPIIEMCGSCIFSLEVSAEIIWACCNDVQTNTKLLRLQDKCLNVRKVMVIASDCSEFGQQLRPSAKDISSFLSLFLALIEVRIISSGIFRDQTIHEVLTSCRSLRRLYILSYGNLKINYAPLPNHGTLELIFLELSDVYANACCNRLLRETLSNLLSPRYILLKIGDGKYPSIKTLNAFFATRIKLRWLVFVFNNDGRALLCHTDEYSRTGLEIIKVSIFHLGNMIHTYPELYDIFWSEFQKFSTHPLY
ncbi:unnamed protein product [Dibothriocephalus latus]|uniref:Uncharacterized protein n=1 Tax=Dibothriocephalus latus TaxID=60516 RepID=A0A3P7P7C4_DIBLA|nr:unnamed protein product [Dibothriocephalus latus]